MLKLRSISKLDFDQFAQEQETSNHFMQTSSWGEFDKVTNHTTPYYLGLLNDEEQIVAATLLLEKHLPMNCCCLYAPRGFVIDYKNKRLLTIFTNKLRDFAKHKNAISITINPSIISKTYDRDNNETINEETLIIKDNLKHLGYKKQTKTSLPRVNYCINLRQDLKTIGENYSEDIKKKLTDNQIYDIELTTGTQKDLEELFTLDETINKDYYETLYDIFSHNNITKVKLFLGKLHITKTLKTLEKDLGRINNQMSIIPIDNLEKASKEKLANLKQQRELVNNNIKKFRNYKLEYGNYLIISAALLLEHQDTVWVLKEASNHILDETNLNYTIYNEYIKYYKDHNFHLFKQLSPIEDQSFNDFSFFGSTHTKYIGEYDLITNYFMYYFQKKILPIFNKNKK